MTATSPGSAQQASDGVTLVGLVMETAAGLRRIFGPGLEDEIGVGGQSFEILLRLSRSPGQRLRLSDLAAQTGLTPSGLTRGLDRLVDAGLVRREACPSDRRGAFAHLTAEGAERMGAACAQHELAIAGLFGGVLDEQETATLVRLLERLRDRVHPGALAGSGEEPPK